MYVVYLLIMGLSPAHLLLIQYVSTDDGDRDRHRDRDRNRG